MIKIEHEEFIDIIKEYKEKINVFFDLEKDENKIDKAINNAKKAGEKNVAEMLQFFQDSYPYVIDANILRLRFIRFQFFKAFSKEIIEYNNASSKEKEKTSFGIFKAKMEYYYTSFTKKEGRWLTKRLNIKVCPYCNRQYTFTIDEDEIKTRPQFDHFYPKSKYPILAISFYNLVPSCSICNLLKKENDININPYVEGFSNEYRFHITDIDDNDTLDWLLKKNELKIKFSTNNHNIEKLGLEELYNEHIDFVEEIIDKSQAYNFNYYSQIIEDFKGTSYTPEEINRFIWGTYLSEKELCKRPLSKLTRDLLMQLGIVF